MITVTYSCGCRRKGDTASPAGMCPTHGAAPSRLEVDRPEGSGRPSFKDWKALRALRVECGLSAGEDTRTPAISSGVSTQPRDPALGTITVKKYRSSELPDDYDPIQRS